MLKLNQKGVIAQFLVFLILAAGIGVGIYLVQTGNLKLFSKAANPPIVFKSASGQPLPIDGKLKIPVSNSPTVMIEFTSTLGPPAYGISRPLTNVSRPVQSYTKSFRFAENPADLNAAPYQPYTKEPMVVYYTFFKNPRIAVIGPTFIWVDFLASNGRKDRRSAQIQITSTAPIPTPSPTASPSASPSVNCYDTDGGRKPNVAGTVYFQGKKYGTDSCNFNDPPAIRNKKVLEYWCETSNSKVVQHEWMTCANGCSNGACK